MAHDINDRDLEGDANVVALRRRLDAYRKEHNLTSGKSSKWRIPESMFYQEAAAIQCSGNAFEVDYFRRTRFEPEHVDVGQGDGPCPLGHDDYDDDDVGDDPSPSRIAMEEIDMEITHVGILNRLHDIAVKWDNVDFFAL
jgi:hypothetical protein